MRPAQPEETVRGAWSDRPGAKTGFRRFAETKGSSLGGVWRINSRVSLSEEETSLARIERHDGDWTQGNSKEGGREWVPEMDG